MRELVSEETDETDELCDRCERPLEVKRSRAGRFLGCTGYPECEGTAPLRVGVCCEKCGTDMIERRQKGRHGRVFYGCVAYPECEHTLNPMPQPRPGCRGLLVAWGRTRRNARCPGAGCGFTGPPPKFEPQD